MSKYYLVLSSDWDTKKSLDVFKVEYECATEDEAERQAEISIRAGNHDKLYLAVVTQVVELSTQWRKV